MAQALSLSKPVLSEIEGASEAAVLRFVADTASAIGYLPYCSMDPRVRPILLIDADGRLLPPDTPVSCDGG